MRILAFDSSAKSASVCIFEDGFGVVAEYFQNAGLTHSKTLMPLIDDILKNTGLELKDMDYLAASIGPGSFTGIRIGLSTLKGLCLGAGKEALAVSTLSALAQNCRGLHDDAVICAVMDARRNEFYNALFSLGEDKIERIRDDRTISCAELLWELENIKKPVFILGDGAKLCYNQANDKIRLNLKLVPENLLLQRASGVAAAAAEAEPRDAASVLPSYLRLSQAERERLDKAKNK